VAAAGAWTSANISNDILGKGIGAIARLPFAGGIGVLFFAGIERTTRGRGAANIGMRRVSASASLRRHGMAASGGRWRNARAGQ